MNLDFNAEEILEIACQIERNGARYYRRAAELVGDESAKLILTDLAVMEDSHEIVFEMMRGDPDLLSTLLGDADGPAVLYLKALAGGHIFRRDADPSADLRPGVSVEEVFERAIEMEIRSIAFYEGVRKRMTPELGRSKIEAIMDEEMGHVALLSRRLDEAMGRV